MAIEEELRRRLQGRRDSRGIQGILSRGRTMFPGGFAARSGGGPGIGRPPMGGGGPSVNARVGQQGGAFSQFRATPNISSPPVLPNTQVTGRPAPNIPQQIPQIAAMPGMAAQNGNFQQQTPIAAAGGPVGAPGSASAVQQVAGQPPANLPSQGAIRRRLGAGGRR